MIIGQVIRIKNDVNFFKHPVHLKWDQIFWNILYKKIDYLEIYILI